MLLEKRKNKVTKGKKKVTSQLLREFGVTYATGFRGSFGDDVGLVVEACRDDGATGLGGEG